MSQESSRPLLHGLESSARPSRTLQLRFDPVSVASMRRSNDHDLLFDVVVAPAAAEPHEQSRAVARLVRDVLWQQERDRCRNRADL
jgi:hypothetical protein